MPTPLSPFRFVYTLLWQIIQPLLHLSPRLRQGWSERVLEDIEALPQADTPFDIWIQAASGGEAILATMVIERLPHLSSKSLRILATSTTSAGVETLQKISVKEEKSNITVRYFPLDNPLIMERAFTSFSPKLAVLVETELWPAFLMTARKRDTPVMVINGRMSAKSHRSYSRMRLFFRKFAPDYVLAMSKVDGSRYADLIGEEKVEIVPNIKFDRVQFDSVQSAEREQKKQTAKRAFLPPKCRFIVFGSIRKEEEEKVLACIKILFAESSSKIPIVAAIFPKHIKRTKPLYSSCRQQKIPCSLKSSLNENKRLQAENAIIIWDSFGELADAYAMADAAFVGGSLCTWGGHNFLEPLTFGIRPIIGIHWQNFARVGRWIIECGLVSEVHNERELVAALQRRLEDDTNSQEILQRVRRAIEPMQGGTTLTCQKMITILKEQL